MTAAQGDIVVDGVSLTTHTHTDPIGIAGRQTSTPN
jgi:riboflavin synthase alpha subunit